MASNSSHLIYAIKDGEIVSIDNVERGLKCGCVCPACGERLVARKGERVTHHFAHYSGSTCEYGFESSLHLAAKDIISKAKSFWIPKVEVEFRSYKTPELISEAKQIHVDRVELEKHLGDMVPDIVIYSGNKKLFVEILVTHAIDNEKLAKIKDLNVSTIEINLSKCAREIDFHILEKALVEDSEFKTWKYNSLSEKWYNQFLLNADRKPVVSRGFAVHVDDCPINTRKWRGKSYANLIDDCLYCEYCVYVDTETHIMCTGGKLLSHIKDFSVPYEKRKRDSDEMLDSLENMSIAGMACPYCHHKLVLREGRHGKFYGCSNYPHCEYTAYYDPVTGGIRKKR